MPLVRSLTSKHYTLLAISISLSSKIISSCSCYAKKGLVCIMITTPFSRQPSFYLECTKTNICLLYNVYLISINKCIFMLY